MEVHFAVCDCVDMQRERELSCVWTRLDLLIRKKWTNQLISMLRLSVCGVEHMLNVRARDLISEKAHKNDHITCGPKRTQRHC